MKDILKIGSRGMDVRALQTTLNTLGAELDVDGIFGDATFHAVCDFQTAKALDPDGVVGPFTCAALGQAMVRKKHDDALPVKPPEPPPRKTDDDLSLAGEKAVERALAMWKLDIFDPKLYDDTPSAVRSNNFITDMIHNGLGWLWEPVYDGDGDFEWCGAFAAKCWEDVKEALRKAYFASTYRLDRFGQYRSVDENGPVGDPPDDGCRLCLIVDGDETCREEIAPRAGDIILIGCRSYGHHIALVESYDEKIGVFKTIEGNAFGDGPNGEHQQGVVRTERSIASVRRLIRPGVDDLK